MGAVHFRFYRIRKRDICLTVTIICLMALAVRNLSLRVEAASLQAMSWTVANKVIVIDPGHGGGDPGAVGASGTLEKDITLSMAKRLEKLFSQAGAVVILTREADVDLSDPDTKGVLAKKRQDLGRRVALANKNKADVYLSIHVNSFPSTKWSGAQTFYQGGQQGSKNLAEAIQEQLRKIMGNTKRVAKAMDFYTNRETEMPSTIIEIGFMSNFREEKLMKQADYQNRLTWSIYSGVVKYFSSDANIDNDQPKAVPPQN